LPILKIKESDGELTKIAIGELAVVVVVYCNSWRLFVMVSVAEDGEIKILRF